MTTTAEPITVQRVVPEPGIYEDVPAEVYHSWPCASNSNLGEMDKSPRHYRACLDGASNDEETKSKSKGTAVHAALLEPAAFEATYLVGPDVNRNSNQWKAFVKAHPGACCLKPSEYAEILALREAVWSDDYARRLLECDGPRELSVVWDEPVELEDGVIWPVRCKARIDHVAPALSAALDIKTCRDASAEGFSASLYNYGYWTQAPWYLRALARHGIICDVFAFIVIETSQAMDVVVDEVDDEVLEIGHRYSDMLLRRVAECERSGEWPGYSSHPRKVTLPPWAWKKIEERMTRNGGQ